MNRNLKIQFFKSTVENVLLYGSKFWTVTKSMEKRLDRSLTRPLRNVQNVNWNDRITD